MSTSSTFLRNLMLLAALLAGLAGCARSTQTIESRDWPLHAAPNPSPTAAYRWVELILETAARRVDRVGAKPTIISRDMMISCEAMFDAWACYDGVAVGTRLGGTLRRPAAERTDANREKAIAMAVTRCLENLYPEDLAWIDAETAKLGADPRNTSKDPATPEGVGNTVAAAILEFRRHDGANQYGDEKGCDETPYSDTSGYKPVRAPGEEQDPDHWMPITFSNGNGGHVTPGFLTPHWYKVKPVGLDSSDQFRPGPPPKCDSPEMKKEVDECIEANASLSLKQKAIVEFMRDGPRSTGQSGHWLRFAQDISRRDHHTLDQDVKLYFAVANVAFDAFISCWETKRFYDSSRPYWYVRWFYKGQMIRGFAGPCLGVKMLRAEDWHPYSPDTFVTPPFPGYTSGHATVSGACAKILELFTGSDRFEFRVKRRAGELTESGCSPSVMQAVDGKQALDAGDTTDIDLLLPTLSGSADMAAESRLLGGYHIRTDNTVGLQVGRKLAAFVFARYKAYWEGTAPAPK